MKKFLLVLFMALSLAGCSSHHSTAAQGPSIDQQFVQSVHSGAPDLASVPDTTLIDTGHTMCNALANGQSPTQIIVTVNNAGLSYFDAGYLLGASVAAYCPQYENELQNIGNDLTSTPS